MAGEEQAVVKAKRQRLSIEQRIARHEAQAARLRAQKQRRSRQLDTREKIIIGGTIVAAMRDDSEWRARVVPLLREKVTRDIDREVIAEWLSATSMQA